MVQNVHNINSFLVDTGSIVSIVPMNFVNFNPNTQNQYNKSLYAANGTPIRVFGNKNLSIDIHGRKFGWNFLIAEVKRPIIGSDFLTHF